jgi:hypothetical protein
MKFSRIRLLEFFVIGLLLGIVEDLLAITWATDAKIDLRVIGIAFIVALPFAILSEIVVDQKRFPQWLHRLLSKIEGLEQKVEQGVEEIKR